MYMDKKSAVLFQLSKDDHSIFFNVTCLDETSSAVQVEKPASGCDINTIPRDTILEFFFTPSSGFSYLYCRWIQFYPKHVCI